MHDYVSSGLIPVLPDLITSLVEIALPILSDPLQASATILSITGAILVASPATHRRMGGFGIWIISNSLWIAAGLRDSNSYIAFLFSIYLLTSVRGMIGAWRGPKILHKPHDAIRE